jgi:hypothetical protein
MKIKANSIEEAREMLLKRGIFAFQKTAGYIPPRATEFDNLPTFNEVKLWSTPSKTPRNCVIIWSTDSMTFRSVIKCHESLCRSCSEAINNYLGSTIALYFYFDNEERCCCCGDMIEDEFPF